MKQVHTLVGGLLITVLILQSSMLLVPRQAHAQFGAVAATIVGDVSPTGTSNTLNLIKTAFESTIDVIKNTITSIAAVATEIATYALYIKAWVLDPLAFVLSGNLLKSITAGVLNFVNGNNSTGAPSYIQDLRRYTRDVGDTQALAFFNEFGSSNSPFANSILSSLRANYLQGTSANGFWAQNQCTLGNVSANINGFLGGDFHQGGWSAWFTLTTQPQNDPYSLYYNSQAQLAMRVGNAQAAKQAELNWGQGFLSWCGDQGSSAAAPGANQCPAGQAWNQSFQACAPVSIGSLDSNCTKSDGTAGQIQTPGSVIHDSLNKALGVNLDKISGMGSIGPDVLQLFQSLKTTLDVVAYGEQILGGGGSGGLFGASQPSNGGLSAVARTAALGGYGGSSQATINQGQQTYATQNQNAYANAETGAQQSVPATYGQPATTPTTGLTGNGVGGFGGGGGGGVGGGNGTSQAYIAAESIIGGAADAALTSLNQVVATCQNNYGAHAGAVIANFVNPTINTSLGAVSAQPSVGQVIQAQSDAQTTNAATNASACGEFQVSGGTIVDQLNLLKQDASLAVQACNRAPGLIQDAICAP